MMLHEMTGDDVLSLSMFWAGALMVFTPLIAAATVLTVWWRTRRRPEDVGGVSTAPAPDRSP
jgi:hypothetical protein